ncbi:NADH-ubiquinone oxidoreductase 21 kDa subunit, mitochondrial [Ophiocordyceps camponoti-floridani]|uniref:NADH dehydrogenase [ubiquinone] iron-sulfur protein 4, mitochondrial n=1 Tax=Ophiocordyceps camponoti-floridani TaxID=2030778 RepID=A0A8H4Q3Z4_9HYPO|nr:NADH-ubiquinone oxidoreductase 21 kDa subunit, mitochondrial [Ophiocordyceps camponoti-floridani]
MASIRSHSARRLWQTAVGSRVPFASTPRRFESAVATRPENVPAVPTSNQPDYNTLPDKATSTFTPVPKRLQEGSEDTLPAAIISGAPMELQARTVRIYKETKPATQSGDFRGHHWRMDWDILPVGHRWENELMGWQSSGDYMQGTHLNFETKEDAINFADKQGYEYFVQEPNSRKFTPKAYANNFLYSPKKLKHIRTK